MILRHIPDKAEAGTGEPVHVSLDRKSHNAPRGIINGRPARGPKHERPAPRRKED
ncbi:hypothetical protein SAMN05443573_11368 [Celeribacter indicus]|nr:hypothetical protein SAMN05443573_11368 [Celeribacter indicus]